MDKERKLAVERGYEDPVNDTYEATGEMYNMVVDKMLTHIARVGGEKCNIVCATHNEAAARHAASKVSIKCSRMFYFKMLDNEIQSNIM